MKIFILTVICIILQINNTTAAFWQSAHYGNFPATAIVSGTDKGENIYSCRVWYNGDLVPGKLVPSIGGCYIGYEGKEIFFTEYDVAIDGEVGFSGGFCKYGGPDEWTKMLDGGFVGSQKQILYVCRAKVNTNDWTVGKLDGGKCWASYGGVQKSFDKDFQTLYHWSADDC